MTRIDDIPGVRQDVDPFASCPTHRLPERGADRERFDERPAAVEKWINGLPLANLTAAGRQLLDTLDTLSRIGLNPAPRTRVLQQLEPSVDYVCEGLRKLYLNVPPPLPSRPRAAAQLALQLREEMARGYRMALVTNEVWRKRSRRVEAATLYGVVHHCTATLVESWGLYKVPPTGCWHLLHVSRRRALEGRLHQRTIHKGKPPRRIEDLYLQVLLTAAAGPYQMGRGEALEAFRTLARVAPRAQLLPAGDAGAAGCPFRLDPERDAGPMPAVSHQEKAPSTLLSLCTQGMVDEVRKQLKGTGMLWWRKTLPTETATRLKRLTMTLAAATERRESREPDRKPAAIVVGLSHIHRLIDSEDREHLTPSRFQAHSPSPPETALEQQDVWDQIYSGDVLKNVITQEREEAQWVSDYSPEQSQAETFWRLVNSSPGGYCLLSLERESRAQVGDLVIINTAPEEQTAPEWQVGVIRWLRHGADDGLQLGIQTIGRRPTPLYARGEVERGRYSEPSRCLLLPGNPDQETPATLILPTLHFHEGQRVLIRGHEDTGEVRLEEPVERTALFGRYAFRYQESTGKADDESLWADI
ncbi:MAG: hypothetical protein JJT90_14545 [Ectothiorhodospiraceae bacterium]|nr:hypothetical protein [Ectothiorhodospiraceae bacterium]